MINSRRNVQLFGYPVRLPVEQEVPGFRVRPPEVEVPGFRVNPDGSARSSSEWPSSLAGYASSPVVAGLTQPLLEPRISPEPGIDVEVAPEPPPPPNIERNLLGIPPELLIDPLLQPFYMDVPGRVLPRARPWPWRRPGQ